MNKKTRKILKISLWLVVFMPIIALFSIVLFVGIFAEIPSFEELENPHSNLATELISEDGEILNTYHLENRSYVGFEDLSPSFVAAAIATEDIRFYSHSGIDFKSLARVAVKTVLLGDTRSGGGGSTISQQLAKTLFPRNTSPTTFKGEKELRLIVSKFKEWITAVKIERNYTKNEIITMYANAIFFGSNAFGIKAASNTFFAKEPWELNIEESATLVGMVNKPTRFNPALNYEKSIVRRNHVLRQMEKYELLSTILYDSIVKLPIMLQYKQQDHNSGKAPYFRDMLRRKMNANKPKRANYNYKVDYNAALESWEEDPLYGWLNKNFKIDGSKYSLDRDGLRIYTTINSKMQDYAEEAVTEHLGSYLQSAFFADMAEKENKPFALGVTQEQAETLMGQARKWSGRYRNLKEDGVSVEEIEKVFRKPVKMRVFSWNKDRYIDTVMTPNDSIRYYKSYLRASFVAMEPHTGDVKAYVGGPNYRYFKYDNVSQAKRQVGSTIKPFLYTLAMQEGYKPCDKVLNVPQSFIVGDTTWTPKSVDRRDMIGKEVTLKWGLTRSSNNISAYLMKQFGPKAMVEMCRKLGISTYLAPYPALCLGPSDITLAEMVGAYNTYPSRGVYVNPVYVHRIEDQDGNVISTFAPRREESISEATAYLMVNLMEGVVNEGTAGRLRWRYGLKGVAGKTGTTNDQSDGWFIGYTPKLTGGVWVGAEDRQVHFETLALGGGSNTALPIWGLFMQKVLEDGTLGITPNDKFLAPPGIVLNLDCDGSDSDASAAKEQEEESFFDF